MLRDAFAHSTIAIKLAGYGFNAGSALLLPEKTSSFSLHGSIAALTAVNTALAGGSAAVSALIGHNWYNGGSFRDIVYDLPKALNGTLCGLVAVTAGCGVLEPWAAVVVGMIAGIVYLASSRLLIKYRIDDAVDAIPVHLSGGVLGMLWVGFMASPNRMQSAYGTSHAGFMYTLGSGIPDASLLAAQVVGIVFIMGWVTALMVPFFLAMNYLNWLRTDTLEEIAGLDACYQVATQEDNDDLKLKIQEEFQKFKKDRQRQLERASTSDGMSSSSIGGNSVNSGASLPRSREKRLSSVLEDNEAGEGSGDLTSADFFLPKKSSSTTSSNKPLEAA
jgi:ammonia channel protein AmtB